MTGRTRGLGTTFTLAALAAALVSLGAAGAAEPMRAVAGKAAAGAGAAKAALIKRGEYLVTIGGCNDCHTPGTFYGSPDYSRRLSGSEVGWQGAWGISFARNLTPDPETGLGYWTQKDYVNAFRKGVKPDGKPLMPPMPWPNIGAMNDADLNALIAYLQALPPVVHKVPDLVAPGGSWNGSAIVFPPPSAWDAPRTPAAGGAH